MHDRRTPPNRHRGPPPPAATDRPPGRNGDIARLIDDLSRQSGRTPALPPPFVRATRWIGLVAALAVLLALFADLDAMTARLTAQPEAVISLVASVLTMVLAALAAFQISLPDRSPLWALLPLPTAALWVGAAISGYARVIIDENAYDPTVEEVRDGLLVILVLALPLCALLVAMLRRAFPLWPRLAAATAGLAAGSAALSLYVLLCPWDAAAVDLAINVLALALVIGASLGFGAPALTRRLGGKIRRRT